jgi:hypothetical protein
MLQKVACFVLVAHAGTAAAAGVLASRKGKSPALPALKVGLAQAAGAPGSEVLIGPRWGRRLRRRSKAAAVRRRTTPAADSDCLLLLLPEPPPPQGFLFGALGLYEEQHAP